MLTGCEAILFRIDSIHGHDLRRCSTTSVDQRLALCQKLAVWAMVIANQIAKLLTSKQGTITGRDQR